MASGGEEGEDGGIPLDIDNVHMLLQVEQEQIQKRTFTNWINAQLATRCPPSFVSDLYSDLRDGSQLLDLLEVMSGQCMKRQRGRGVFQQRANIETALNFLKKKSIKLVNINVPDIIDGRPSIILGLVWTIILHCHIEELASALSFSSRHSSLDSLTSLDSWTPDSPVPASPVPTGRTSPLHRRFRVSAKKALLMWVRDQCQRVGSSIHVKDFKSSWRSGEAFLAVLCSLRPQLVDLSLVQSRSNQENLEEAFYLAERELHIPRLLEPQDVDVKDPDEKSIMTYVAQFLQYSNDMPAPDDHLQVSLSDRAHEVISWLQQSYLELSDSWISTVNSGYGEKYQVFQNLAGSFSEQRRHVTSLLSTVSRRPELSRELHDLRAAWDRMEEELQRCKAELDLSLPPPLDAVVLWLQRVDAALTDGGGTAKDHADIAKEARAQQETLKTLIDEISHYVNILDDYNNTDDSGNMVVPVEKFDEIKRRVTHIRVTTKYHGIKLEYREYRHTVLDLLNRVNAKIRMWKSPYRSEEDVHVLLQDWHETVEHQGLLLILMDSLQNLKEKANTYTSKAALGEDSQIVQRQVKEAESEVGLVTEAVTAVRGRMERVASALETYNKCLTSLQMWITQTTQSELQSPAAGTQDMSEWMSCHAKLNEAGNFLIETMETSTSHSLAEQLSKVNKCWAECVKRTKFEVTSEPSVSPPCLQMVHSLTQEVGWILRQPLDVASVPLKATRQKLQLLSKKLAEVDVSSVTLSLEIKNQLQTLPQILAEAERSCWEMQRAASRLEGRLAELDRWSSDALDCYEQLQEKDRRRRSALDSTAKVLLSRGLQLEKQVVIEGQDLQDFIDRVRKTCPLQHLSACGLQDRVSEAISHYQEILGLFTSLGFEESVHPTERQQETGGFVLARTKHATWTDNIKFQNQDPSQLSTVYPSHVPQQRARDPQSSPENQGRSIQDETTIVIPTVQIQMLPQPFCEPVPHFHFPESKPVIQLQCFPESHNQSLTQSAAGQTLQKSPVLQSETQKSKSSERSSQSLEPPVMVVSEVHSKAQAMARSRMEKARVRLQEHIQQSIKLFSSKVISESQAKKKKWALKILQPVVLEEFLDAVEGFGAFCSEPQLQDVMLQSETVRKQWEDVRREMAAFVSILWSKISEGEQSFSVLMCTNILHNTTDQTDPDSFQQQQAVVDGGASVEERVESLRELCETVTQSKSSGENQLNETHKAQETQPTDTVIPTHREKQLGGNTPLRSTGMTANTQTSSYPPQKQSVEIPQKDLTPVFASVPQCGETLPLRCQDVLMEREEPLTEHTDAGSVKNQKPSPRAKAQLLNVHRRRMTERNEQVQSQVRMVVSGDTVETKQVAEWTSVPETETVVPQQEEHSPEQEVLERMSYVVKTADLMESADHQTSLMSQKLDEIITQSVDVSSFRFAAQNLESDLKETDDRQRKPLKQTSQEEKHHPETTSLHQGLQGSVGDHQEFRQQLWNAPFAAQAVDHFILATMRNVEAEIPALLANPDTNREQNEAEQELERHSRQIEQQSLQTEQSDVADRNFKAAGMTLTTDGATVTYQEVVTSLPKETVEVEGAIHQESKNEIKPMEQEQMQSNKEFNPVKMHVIETHQEQEHPPPCEGEQETSLVAKRSKVDAQSETQRVEEHKADTWRSEGDVGDQRRRRSYVKKEGEEKHSFVQRRAAFLGTLREIKRAAQHLRLHEATLPALQLRKRALTELDSRLAGLLSELHHIQDSSSSGIHVVSQSSEVKDVWEETTKAVNERLELCCFLIELMKRFQSLRAELSGTLQRAETTITEKTSYMGKDNLQRLHTKVQETKADLQRVGDDIEDVRSVCRQIHSYLRQMPECNIIPFENEADTLTDSWLDISERTDSHLENLHLGLTLWDGALHLGAEVENWTSSKLNAFVQSPSFQSEDDIRTLQNEILSQEKRVEHFERKATEIQSLLQSTDPLLELQVTGNQMRKKLEQLKELAAEAEDIYGQTVAAKEQISLRTAECFKSLQKIQESLLTLSGSDVATVLARLKDLCLQLQTQDEHAEVLIEDLQVLSSISSPHGLQSLRAGVIQLQDEVQNSHQLFSEVEERTQQNIQDLDRLQRECEHLERWLHDAEEKAAKGEDVSLLQEEALKLRVRTDVLSQLVSSIQSGNLHQAALVHQSSKLLERYHNFHSVILNREEERQRLQSTEEACSRLEEGAGNEEHFHRLLQDCHYKLTSMQDRMSACRAQKQSSAGQFTCVTDVETLLQDLADLETQMSHLEAIKDTVEAQTSLSHQVSNLQQHKRALDHSIRETLALLTVNGNQRVQVKYRLFSVHEAVKDLAENVGNLCVSHEVLTDVRQLKQQWCIIQDFESRLTELASRVYDLQDTDESSVTREIPPADDNNLTVDGVTKDFDSLRSIFLQKKLECTEDTANRVSAVVRQLQHWRQMVQAEPAPLSQAAADEGLQLQHHLRALLTDKDFLPNILGTTVLKELEKKASVALSESTCALNALPKCQMTQGPNEVELNQKDTHRSHSASPDEMVATCPPDEGRSESDQNDAEMINKALFNILEKGLTSTEPTTNNLDGSNMEVARNVDETHISMELVNISVACIAESFTLSAKKGALEHNEVPNTRIPFVERQESQQLTPKLDMIILEPNKDIGDINTDGSLQSTGHQTHSGNTMEPFGSDSHLHTLNKSLPAQQENAEPLQEDTTSILDSKLSAMMGNKSIKQIKSSPCNTSVTPAHKDVPPFAQTDASKGKTDAHERLTPKTVYTIVLEMEPRVVQESENVGAELIADVLNTGFTKERLDLLSKSLSPKSNKTDLRENHLAGHLETIKDGQKKKDMEAMPKKVFTIVLDMEPQGRESGKAHAHIAEKQYEMLSVAAEDETHLKCHSLMSLEPKVSIKPLITGTELDERQSTNAKLTEIPELMRNRAFNSSTCQPTAAHTFPSVKQEATDLCHTVSSVIYTVDSPEKSGDTFTETRAPSGDNEQTMGADTAEGTGTGAAEVAGGGNTEEPSGSEGPESNKHQEVTERRGNTLLLKDERKDKLPASLEDTEVTQEQPQMQEDMEPERTALSLSTGETAMSSKSSRSTMLDILSEIQSLAERGNIINRTPHIDLKWYLKSSPGEPEIRLVRTVQQVLACRYQPAQLDATVMAKQLEEAEEYRSSVQEQVLAMKSLSAATDSDPNALKRAEEQGSAALLDASATVQVKAAQLDQVKQYHKQMKMARALLEVLAAEKENMSLNALGSSAVQAEKLHALLQTMERRKEIMEELLHLSSQLSAHLSDAESSGTLLAQLGDVQEDWRLLQGSIKRALRHAKNSVSQSSVLIKEAEHLKAKLEDLQKSSCQSNDSRSALELACLTTDVKLYNQLYLNLKSQSDALVHFSVGQKEKNEIQNKLQELESLLDVTKKMLSTSSSCGGTSLTKINKQLQDLIIWAKQAENHISIGKKMALFPEEARGQIVDMKKFQTDILSQRSKMQAQIEEIKGLASDMEKAESDLVVKTVEDLYEAIADSLDHVLDTMKTHLQKREKLLSQLAAMDAWLAESHATKDMYSHVENVSKADMQKLESELKRQQLATVEIQSNLQLLEAMEESCKDIAEGLSPGESRYLVNRLSGLWTEIDGLLAHEKATSWELEELIHERISSDAELSTIQSNLKEISTDLEKQRFPLTQETLSIVEQAMHMLIENQCQVQALQHCHEAKRSALLCTIGELQDRCKAIRLNAFEQDKYLHLRRQMEESRDIVSEQIQHARDKTISVGERFRLCQTILVELPLVKTQCQEAGDQLEVIAHELHPSQLNSDRQRIHHTVETLVSWEHSVTDDIKNLEAKLLSGLHLSSELPALTKLFQRTKIESEKAKPVSPDEKAIDGALRRYWVIWRNMKSGMRVLKALGRKENINLKNDEELNSVIDGAIQECHLQMETLSQARESLKDYHWAAQGAISFLHNAEATFLSAPGGFLDCTEEQRQTQQALQVLEDGFQAHICHLVELLPQQPCLSHPEVEQLHISILSQLLVGRAILEAQAQLRLESLQRCAVRQQSHRKCHEDVRQRLSGLEARLSECASVQVTSYEKCVTQQKTATQLMEELRSFAGKIEELRAGCPMQGCGVGKDGELGALWRRWSSLRRGVGLLMAHAEQRQEEWKDITTSIQQCCSFLDSLQAEVPDSSTVSFTQEKTQELLVQAEIHQAGLEQEQQALSSLEHRLEHVLSLSKSQDPISPGPVGKTLVKIQENVRSLKERNLLIVAAVQEEGNKRQQVQEEIEEVEKHMLTILAQLEACSNPSRSQELRKDLSSQKTRLKSIMDDVQSRYAEVPDDLSQHLREAELSLQRAEEELTQGSVPICNLAARVRELGSGLEKVKVLLEQKSPTVSEAQNVLKRVWDELDTWHSRLMLLESEVQDLAEEQPDQTHLLMDHLTQPLQLYQDASQMAENRTSFLSKIPVCLKEFDDISYSATCWLDESQAWLSTPYSFTTAKSLQNHAKSLQLVLDDSERIRDMLQDFRPVLAEISAVCDVSAQEDRLDQNDQRVHKMQRHLLEPLEQLLQAAVMVEAMETEIKTMEKNVPKIRTILSSVDDSNITLAEHLHDRQVILANMQSIRRTLEEMEKCKAELPLPQGAEESLLVFSRAKQLLQPLEELEHLTQYQASQLENKIREKEQTGEDVGISMVADFPEEMQQLDTSSLTHLLQEPFAVSHSEEEEDEHDESCHSSSSDTLTCSIPEDPEETLSDLNSEDTAHVKLSSEMEMSSNNTEAQLLYMKPGCDNVDFAPKNVETGLKSVDSEANVGDSSCPETPAPEPPITTVAVADEDQYSASDQHKSPKHETFDPRLHTESLQAAAAVEDTRLIPVRPVTPFTASGESAEFITVEDKDQTLSTAFRQDVGLKEQSEIRTSHNILEENPQLKELSKVHFRLAGGHSEDEEEENQRWSRLYTQISHSLTMWNNIKHQTSTTSAHEEACEQVPEKELVSTRSASSVLPRTNESITTLRQILKSADGSDPEVKEKLYVALQKVLSCLDTQTELLSTPGGAGEDELQLRLVQQECASAELTTLADVLKKLESETRPEDPDCVHCLTCLQDCLCTVQLLFTSSINRLTQRLGFKHQPEFFNQVFILDKFTVRQSETFPNLKDTPNLERCVLGRHLRESPGERANLQQTSQALLQGITHLLEVGEECIKERQMSQVHSRSQLQAALCRHKKFQQVLGSQLAFVQYLFQRESDVLRCQEDERLQLEVRAKALQQQALGQEVASQRRLQEWTLWEDNCGRLGRVLDEFEAFISSGEPEEDDEEAVVQHRLETCQETLVQLNESRAAVGLLLDQCKMLQTESVFAASLVQTGGAVELRWMNALKRAEQEIQRCRDIQDVGFRFHSDFALVSNWLVGANNRLKSWSNLNQECVHNSLIELLDFSMEMEAMSVKRAAVSSEASQLLHLREADSPGLRAQVAQLEVNWSRLTSDLSKIQDQIHQRLLLARWPPVELLSDLETWMKKLQASLSQEKENHLKIKDAAQISEVLLRYQELKAGAVSGQLLLDFLCQSRPQAPGVDVQVVQSECTVFAEKLGALRLQWLHLQRELESQICGAEQMRHTCAVRGRKLKHLHRWVTQQNKQLSQWKPPTSQTVARRALEEWEAVADRAKEVAAALQELKASQVWGEQEEEPPCNITFANQAECVYDACEDLSRQMEVVRPALEQMVKDWSHFEQDLSQVTLNTIEVLCALQHQRVPLFSLKQAEGNMELLQELQREADKGEELWAAVYKSFQSLAMTLHCGTVQALSDQLEGEQKRWKNIMQDLKHEQVKTGETVSLWQEYSRLSEISSLHLKHLRLQWEELLDNSQSPEHEKQGVIDGVEKLQDAAEKMQSSMSDTLEASKLLNGRVEPLAANLIQSETRLLSRDILLLIQAMEEKKKSLQEELENQRLLHTCLQNLEKQIQNIKDKLVTGLKDEDSLKRVLSELSDLFPSLVDVSEMSSCLTLNNQDRERLHRVSKEWTESMSRTSDMNRELQAEHQSSQTFQEKCEKMTCLTEKLVEEVASRKPQSSSCQETLSLHQRHQAEIITGHQLLQDILCDAFESMEKATGEKRSELLAQSLKLRQSWISAVDLVQHHRSLFVEHLRRRRIYHHGSKLLWKLLRGVDPLLPPAGPALYALQQLRNCVDDYQCVEESLDLHSTVFNQTLEAGRWLCETVTESECQSHLQSELQTIETSWKRTTSLLQKRKDLVHTTTQKWSQCQDRISNIMTELNDMKTRMKQQLPEKSEEEKEKLIQETERSLQRLATGLRELGTMKTDLSQYIAAGDSALLEQQLEQLHGQWEELCTKVSLRKQEIADRLNAWTIFNDKNKEFCDWLTQMENKVCHSSDQSIEEMVEKLKKDCMEEINLFSENKSHLKQLGEQLLLASDEAKQSQVRGSLQEVNQRWHNLFHHIEARVKKLKDTLVTVQQLDKNMSNLRSWLSRIEAELSRPITYSVCHHEEIQRRLAEQQELQRDIEQHTEGIASVLSLCDVLLSDEDAAGSSEVESVSLKETSHSLDQRWRAICAMALDRRLRIEETWKLWCKFLDDYSRFEDWLKIAEYTAANPNSAGVLYTVAKEELKKFEGFQRQVQERLTQLEIVNNQYRRLARENRTDQASQLKAMVHEGNRRWDTLHRRVAAILRRLKYFTSQREEFEGTRESVLVWLTELDLQLTNVEHFSESDVHHKIRQLNSFQKEITLNTERIDGLIVFGEGLIQRCSPQDAALIEEELEELYTYCQEVFSRLVRFHQRLSQPPLIKEEPELSGTTFSLESSLELIGRSWLGRGLGSLPATPTHPPISPLERSGCETPVSVDSLPLEWDHTGDVGGSSSPEDDDEEEEHEEEERYFSALSVSSRSMVVQKSSVWRSTTDTQSLHSEDHIDAAAAFTSTPRKQGYLGLMSQCSGSIEDIKRVSLILDEEEEQQPQELGLTGLNVSDKQSGVIERWELLEAQSRSDQLTGPQELQQLTSDLDHLTSWLESMIPELERPHCSTAVASIADMEARARELKEMQRMFTHYKSIMLSVNLRAQDAPELQQRLLSVNRDWSRVCTALQQWDTGLRKTLMRCQEFHQTLHSLLLWLAHAESRRYAVDISDPETRVQVLQQHCNTLTHLQEELQGRQKQQTALQALWSQLQPEDDAEDRAEAQEKLHVTGSKLRSLLRDVDRDLSVLQQRLNSETALDVQGQSSSAEPPQEAEHSKKVSSTHRETRESSPPRSFFYRVLRAAFPLHLLLLLLLLLPCLIPQSESDTSCNVVNNFARSFYPMLRYTNGPPPT